MSEENENKPTLGRKPLGLKLSTGSGEVKQTFSHGRTNKVVVEVKRKKLVGKPGYAPEPEVEVAAPPPPPPPAPPPPAIAAAPVRKAAPNGETPQERVARLQLEAEEDRLRQSEEANRREQEERLKAAEEERRRVEENRKAESAPVPVAAPQVEVAQTDAPAEEAGSATAAPPPARRFTPVEAPKRPVSAPVSAQVEREREDAKKAPHKPSRDRAGDNRRQSGKLTVTRALDGDDGARARSLAALKRAREKEKRLHFGGSQRAAQPKQARDVAVPEAITVQELAIRMAEKGSDLVKTLFKMGMPVTLTETIDQDTAELLVTEFGHNINRVSDSDVDIAHEEDVDAAETLKPRPPVVTVMGHSIMAKPACWTPFVVPMLYRAKRAGLPSISVHIR